HSSSLRPTSHQVECRQIIFSYLRPNRWLLPLFQRHQLHEDDRNHNHGESVNQKQPITLFAPSLSFDGKKHYFLLLLKNLHTGERSTDERHTSLDRDLSCSGQSLENIVNVLTLANLCSCIATFCQFLHLCAADFIRPSMNHEPSQASLLQMVVLY